MVFQMSGNKSTSACGGVGYVPVPSHVLSRETGTCLTVTRQQYKAEILQCKQNSAQLSRAQQYSMLSRNALTRKKSWATQTQTYTNPNVDNLPEIKASVNGVMQTVHLNCYAICTTNSISFSGTLNVETVYVDALNNVIQAPVVNGYTVYRITSTTGIVNASFSASIPVQYFIIGGGGAGGPYVNFGSGGGGGAGGYLTGTILSNPSTLYSITVGQGGQPGTTVAGSSNFGTLVASGGGNGSNGIPGVPGGNGGCGGGGAGGQSPGNPNGIGIGYGGGNSLIAGGGGGGTNQVGGNASSAGGPIITFYIGGNGGNGYLTNITGTTTTYGGGGGGGNGGQGGTGGGGNGASWFSGTNVGGGYGTDGLGGGGGGGTINFNGTVVLGAGNGGSGVVILRIPSSSCSMG
jgi:hypothetical protein